MLGYRACKQVALGRARLTIGNLSRNGQFVCVLINGVFVVEAICSAMRCTSIFAPDCDK